MGVSFNCDCGKRLRVKHSQIDDKVKCPKCSRVLVVREKVANLSESASKLAEDDAPNRWPLWLLALISIGIVLFVYKAVAYLQRDD
jgi:DNA-directed RNA polymerase subunit RPC12/RpoP